MKIYLNLLKFTRILFLKQSIIYNILEGSIISFDIFTRHGASSILRRVRGACQRNKSLTAEEIITKGLRYGQSSRRTLKFRGTSGITKRKTIKTDVRMKRLRRGKFYIRRGNDFSSFSFNISWRSFQLERIFNEHPFVAFIICYRKKKIA